MNIQLSDHFTYRRLIRFTISTVLMLICTSMYSIVDGLFVSNYVGKMPFEAKNLIVYDGRYLWESQQSDLCSEQAEAPS